MHFDDSQHFHMVIVPRYNVKRASQFLIHIGNTEHVFFLITFEIFFFFKECNQVSDWMYNGIVEYIKPWTTLVVEFKYENINKMTIRYIR